MNKYILSVVFFFFVLSVNAAEPQREFRAVWYAAVGVDFPNNKVTTTGNQSQINAQKNEVIAVLDALVAANMNVIFYHMRVMADAFYPSDIVPWSHYLTNTRGKDPGYDPFAFAIEEAHKRGIEIHAWMNPYRYTSGSLQWPATDYINRDHPNWVLDLGKNTRILDPGNPAVRQHITDVTEEVIVKYPEIDGVVWDDYFYEEAINTGNQDNASYNAYNPQGLSLKDWRRDNVNKTVQSVYNVIQAHNPGIRFGISPRGIWGVRQADANQYGVTLPAGITGADNYNGIYCDGLAWLSQGTIDYISPQLYWATVAGGGAAGQDYTKLAPWWQMVADKYNRHFYSSMGLYRWFSTTEVGREMNINRYNSESPGAVYFSTKSFLNTSYAYNTYLKNNFFQKQILPPKVTWKTAPVHNVSNVRKEGNTLKWDCAQTDGTFVIYAVPNNLGNVALNDFTYMVKRHWTKTNSIDLSELGNLANTHKFAVASVNRMLVTSTPVYEGEAPQPTTPTLTVSVSSLPQFTCEINKTQTATFTVTGSDLTANNISVSSSNAAIFTVSPTSLGKAGGTVTVTFKPAAAQAYSATVTVSSTGVSSKTVTLTGMGRSPDAEQLKLTEGWNFSEQKNNKTSKGWDASKVRNMAYGAGKLYLVYETNNIKVVKSQTGDILYDLDKTGVSGGTYDLCDVGYFDGKVIACNLSANSGEVLKVYVWDNDESAPRTLLSTTNKGGVARLGDCMGYTGTWNNGKLSFAYDDGTYTRIVNYTITNGVCNSTPSIVYATTDGTNRLICSTGIRVQPDATGYWINGKANALTRLNASGVRQYEVQQTVKHGNGFSAFNYEGVQYGVLTTFNGNANYLGGTMELVNASAGWADAYVIGEYPAAGLGNTTTNPNCNTVAIAQAGSNYVEAWVSSDGQGVAYYKKGTPPTHNYDGNPTLTVSSSSLSFGDVIQNQTKTLTLNVSGANLDGNISVSSNNAAFTVNPSSLGKSGGTVNVTFKPTALQNYSATITVSANGVDSKTVSLTGKGIVDPATVKVINLSRTSVAMACPYDETTSTTVQITANNLTGSIAVNNSNPAYFEVSPNTLGPTGGTITIVFKPTAETTYQGVLTISADGADSQTIDMIGMGESLTDEINLTERWNFSTNKGTATSKGWDATKVRNMAYGDNGKLYLVYEQSYVKVINAQTGEFLYDLGNAGVTAGVVKLADIAFFDGKLIACNIVTSSNPQLRVYVWDMDEENASPRVLLNTTNIGGTDRLGDYLGMMGNWNSGKLVFARDNGSATTMVTYTINNGVCDPTPTTMPVTYRQGGRRYLACGLSVKVYPDANGYWIDGNAIGLTRLTLDGVKDYEVPQTDKGGNGFSAFVYRGTQYAVMNSFVSTDYRGGTLELIEARNGWVNRVHLGQYPSEGLGNTQNTNCTGNSIGRAGDNYVETWVLSSVQGMAYYAHGIPPEHICVQTPMVPASELNVYLSNQLLIIEGVTATQIDLYTLTGQKIKSESHVNEIHVGDLKGAYIAVIKDDVDNIQTKKVIIN